MTSTNDLRTRLLANLTLHLGPPRGRVQTGLINPDGPEAVAALDERDERIKALEALLVDADLEFRAIGEGYTIRKRIDNLLTNPTPAKAQEQSSLATHRDDA